MWHDLGTMTKAQIVVREMAGKDPAAFEVEIREAGSVSHHRVTMKDGTPRLVEGAFRFLLDRESKESILKTFDVSVISKYFPEFEEEKNKYLSS